jgi:hypothetical protein
LRSLCKPAAFFCRDYHPPPQHPPPVPCSAVRLARVNGELVVNPTKSQLGGSDLDLLLAVRGPERVVMLEMGGAQVSHTHLASLLQVCRSGGLCYISGGTGRFLSEF